MDISQALGSEDSLNDSAVSARTARPSAIVRLIATLQEALIYS